MNENASAKPRNLLALLEWITGFVLILVIGSLAGMIALAYWPELGNWMSTEAQVIAVSVLLSTALILVSVVALLQTRKQ